jgi:hypothetical protein
LPTDALYGLNSDSGCKSRTGWRRDCLAQTCDLVKINQTVEEKLKKAGKVFNRTEPAQFRAVLSSVGY